MRLSEIRTKNILSKADAMLVLREIETGKGGIATLAQSKPIISHISQAWLQHHHGGTLKLFRAIAVVDGKTLNAEKIASLTSDWKVAWRIAEGFPVLFTPNKIVTNTPHLLRYNVPISKVVAYVPALLDECLKTLGEDIKSKRIMSARHYEKISISEIFDTGTEEKEVIADVSSLKPQVIAFEQRSDIWQFMRIVQNNFKTFSNVDQFTEFYKKHIGSSFSHSNDWATDMKEYNDSVKMIKTFIE